jgi:hypothetical protein
MIHLRQKSAFGWLEGVVHREVYFQKEHAPSIWRALNRVRVRKETITLNEAHKAY